MKLSERLQSWRESGCEHVLFADIEDAKELEDTLDWIFAECEISQFFDGALILDMDELRMRMKERPLKPKDSETPSPERPMATISFHKDSEPHGSCIYGLVRDGDYLSYCGKPATTIERITFSSGATEDRFYCSEHAQLERTIVGGFQPKTKATETLSPASPAAP